ncbi:DUF2125 domain-containing protein [Flavimaricola marinus]|uniref:DUF2125 domain-containing protein n=1 Tax=Flavimaricola marinus TaxID=1819565 RepID=A0A238L8H8_9RHOB|nr:DUF2125 domain-containing protein [Flavimaricola marinus]SMY05968.1 hypothetical protein LOM8899_00089 [Flavimaricola marinus]
MRFLIILVAAFAALYGGYWFVGSAASTRAATEVMTRLEADGLEVAYEEIRTIGFPSRFDTTLTDVTIADPARNIGWQAPFFQLFALSYNPTHIIAVWPDRQQFDLPRDTVTLVSERLRASVQARPTPTLPLREATLEGADLRVLSQNGWEVDLTTVLAALRAVTGGEVDDHSYEVYAEATEISLPTVLLQALGGAEVAPSLIERIRLDGRLRLDAPLDRMVSPQALPRVTALTLRDAAFRWGDMSINAVGDLTIDPAGVPEGQITLTVTNWRQVIDVALSAGLLDPRWEPTLTRAASALAQGSDRLEAPIRLQNGFMSLGPLPLGPAPRLR